MSETKQGTLDGRPVELRGVTIGVALAANKAGAGDGFEVSLHVLVASAYWAGTDERVFADRAAIDALPMTLMREVSVLATLAGQINLPRGMRPISNGTGAVEVVPSSSRPSA